MSLITLSLVPRRNIREPLGKAYNRGHVIPEEIATQRGFGLIYGSKQVRHLPAIAVALVTAQP